MNRNAFLLLLGISLLLLLTACSKTHSNRDPVGELFPSVKGESLTEKEFELPRDLFGKKSILILGFVQDSQFDIDRWLLSLKQLEIDLPVYEIPTIRGVVPRMIKGYIDNGMRSGIPEEDWGSVVTVFTDADKIAKFVGTEQQLNARVILLDELGRVLWFHDRGYSADVILDLHRAIRDAGSGAKKSE